MKQKLMKYGIVGGFFLGVLFALAVAFMTKSPAAETPQVEQNFCLTDTLAKHLRLDTVRTQIIQNELTLPGKIETMDDKSVKVFPVVSGRIVELKAQLGDFVKQGQVLAVIQSSEIADYESQIQAAQSKLSLAQKNLSVQQEFLKSGLNAERDVAAAQSEANLAQGELEKTKKIGQIYGVSNGSLFYLKAPISGYVIEKNPQIAPNQQFSASEVGAFFTVADLHEVAVNANVYEADVAKIKVGFPVEISTLAYPNRVFTGKIDKVLDVIDPATHTMKVRIRIPNPSIELKPEMFAQAAVHFESSNQRMTAIPAADVIFDKNKNYVMVFHDKCQIETRRIELFQTTGRTTYVQSGLAAGDLVLASDHMLVYDQLNDK